MTPGLLLHDAADGAGGLHLGPYNSPIKLLLEAAASVLGGAILDPFYLHRELDAFAAHAPTQAHATLVCELRPMVEALMFAGSSGCLDRDVVHASRIALTAIAAADAVAAG